MPFPREARGKRSDIDSWDLMRPYRNAEAWELAGVRPSASGFFFVFILVAPVGNAPTLFPGISLRPYRAPGAWECASASGFFLFGLWFCAAQEKGREMKGGPNKVLVHCAVSLWSKGRVCSSTFSYDLLRGCDRRL
jgi:hypothetical protein